MGWGKFATTALVALAPIASAAQDATYADQNFDAAVNNVSHELTICAAYYFIVADGVRNSGEEITALRYEEVAYHAIQTSALLGENIGLVEQAVLARLELAMGELMEAISYNYANISILMRDHHDSCEELVNAPELRVLELALGASQQ